MKSFLAFTLVFFVTTFARASDVQTPVVRLVVDPPPSGMTADELRDAIAAELHARVDIASRQDELDDTLVLESAYRGAVTASFYRNHHAPVQRTFDLPKNHERAVEIVALMAGNLVRDEAGELLAVHVEPAPLIQSPPLVVAKPIAPVPTSMAPLASRFLGVDFLPLVGMSSVDRTNVERIVSFNAIGGLSGGLRGVEIGGVLNIDAHYAMGVQISGVANIVGGPVDGAQISVINTAGPLHGAQTGVINIAGGEGEGAQIGVVNVVSESTTGTQIGVVNITGDAVSGAQIGVVNIASGEVKGIAIGVVNVAKDADFALGIVNVLTKGRTHLDVWGLDSGFVMFGVKHGGKHFHNIYGYGVRVTADGPRWAFAFGIGAHATLTPSFYLDVDAISYGFQKDNFSIVDGTLHQLRAVVGYSLAAPLAVFAGPTLDVSVFSGADAQLPELSVYGSSRFTNASASTVVRMWPGLTVGVQAF